MLGAKLFVFLGVWRVCVESSHRVCVERRERPQKSCARKLGVEEEAALQGGGASTGEGGVSWPPVPERHPALRSRLGGRRRRGGVRRGRGVGGGRRVAGARRRDGSVSSGSGSRAPRAATGSGSRGPDLGPQGLTREDRENDDDGC